MKLEKHDLESIAAIMGEALPGGQVAEVMRLAELGSWAEEKGIPSLRSIGIGKIAADMDNTQLMAGRFWRTAQAALAALPAVGAAPGEREKR